MLRTSLGRFVLCAASRTAVRSGRRLLPPSELLSPSRCFAGTRLERTWTEQLRFQSSAALASSPPHLTEDPPASNQNENDDKEALPLFTSLSSSIHPATLKALTKSPFQFQHMSSVQAEILPMLPTLALPHSSHPTGPDTPRDLLVKAKTGTGKTIAFLVPAIESRLQAIKAHISSLSSTTKPTHTDISRAESAFARSTVGALIISPTRELATQIAVEATNLTAHHRGWGVQVLLGGESKHRQMRAWDGGRKDIVVATPGRILDLLNTEPSVRDAVGRCELLVLDEADTLLDMGFRDDITRLLTYLPPQPIRQTFLFSATVSRAIQQIARASLSPTHRFVNCVSPTDSDTHAHIPQHVHVLRDGKEMIHRLLNLIAADMLTHTGKDGKQKSRIIVFLSTTNAVSLFSQFLRKALFSSSRASSSSSSSSTRHTPKHILPLPPSHISLFEIHSKRDQSARSRTSSAFRSSSSPCSILITSDVSARGVDYPGITRVIQLGLPSSRETYVHRVGRTGRAGRTDGRGDLVVMDWEKGFVRAKLGDVGVREVGEGEVEREVEVLGDVLGEVPALAVGDRDKEDRGGRGKRPVRRDVVSPPAPTTEQGQGQGQGQEARFGRAAREELRHSASQLISSFSSSPSPSPSPSSSSSSFSYSPSPTTTRTDTQELIHSAFASLAGFVAGRAGEQGIDTRDALVGLRRSWKEMWDLDREPVLPRGLEMGSWGNDRKRGGGGGGGWGGRGRVASGRSGGFGERGGFGGGGGGAFGRRNGGSGSGSGSWGNGGRGSASPSGDSIEGHYNSPDGGNGYGYERGSRQGSKFSRAGRYEHQRGGGGGGGGFNLGGRGGSGYGKERERESSWESGGEGRWNGNGYRRGRGSDDF